MAAPPLPTPCPSRTARPADARPVSVRGVVTLVVNNPPMMFVQDETGGVCVSGPRDPKLRPQLRPGMRVDVEGVTAAGKLTPYVTSRPREPLGITIVEEGEAPELAALREAEEETGLVVALVPGAAPFVAVDPLGGKLVHTFLATVTGGALRGEVPGEGTPCWTTAAELATGPYADYNRRAFDFFGIRY